MWRSKQMDMQLLWILNYVRKNPTVDIPAYKTYQYLFKLLATTDVYFINSPTNVIWMVDLNDNPVITAPEADTDF